MGAWGYGVFDNDTTIDWAEELANDGSLADVIRTLKTVVNEDDYLEMDVSSEGLAAAEVVAALQGRAANDLPLEIIEWVSVPRQLDESAVELAFEAVERIEHGSELRDLWSESGQLQNWLNAIDNLRNRLSAQQTSPKETLSSKKRVRVGDVVSIPLPDGNYGYAQFVFMDKHYGPLIQVFDLITPQVTSLPEILTAGPLFKPVITGFHAAVKDGKWRILGHSPIETFDYPLFITPLYDGKARKVRNWFLWDGNKRIELGRKLPERYINLEQLVVWAPDDVAQRIATGENHLDFRLSL